MNTDQMMYLIDIAKTGSINTTAKRMFSSQQAISESIKRLERELDCTILERSSRGVSLTTDGQFVLNHITPMIEHYHIIQQHFQQINAPSGKLNIAVAQFATNTILTDLIFEMYRQHPNIALFTKEMTIDEMVYDILHKEFDFGIAGFSDDGGVMLDKIKALDLEVQPLYTDNIVCVMHKNNPLASNKILTKGQIEHAKFTCYNNYDVDLTVRHFLHVSSNTNIHKRFMREENTLCMVNSLAFKTFYPEKEFVAIPVQDTSPTTTCLLYRKEINTAESDIYQSFIQTAAALAKQL